MRTLLISMAVVTGMAGCGGMRSPAMYGNFVREPAPAADKRMAVDAVQKLEALYPPARTRINLLQTTHDPFGAALVGSLRMRGYALREFDVRSSDAKAAVSPKSQSDIALAYVIDQPLDADMYRLTILVDHQSLSRLYLTKDGVVAPAGYWVHKE